MQDIKDAEVDSVRDLTGFLDAELDYHERCAEELRRVRQNWTIPASSGGDYYPRPAGRDRSNTARSYTDRLSRTPSHNTYEVEQFEPEALPVRMPPIRSISNRTSTLAIRDPPDVPSRPSLGRAYTVQATDRGGRVSGASTPGSMHNYGVNQNVPNVSTLRGQLRPVTRVQTTREDVFCDRDDDTASGSGSPEWGERSASPATSYGSLSRSTSNVMVNNGGTGTLGTRKAPPPPPPSRSKKPPPPIPAKREIGY